MVHIKARDVKVSGNNTYFTVYYIIFSFEVKQQHFTLFLEYGFRICIFYIYYIKNGVTLTHAQV